MLVFAVAQAAEAQTPPIGTKCVSEYYVPGAKTTGTNVVFFESGGLHRWRLQDHTAPVFSVDQPIELAKFQDLHTSTIETGSFDFAGKKWSMRSIAGKHVWYGNWSNGILEAAADVSGEFRDAKPVLTRNVNCKGNRQFEGAG